MEKRSKRMFVSISYIEIGPSRGGMIFLRNNQDSLIFASMAGSGLWGSLVFILCFVFTVPWHDISSSTDGGSKDNMFNFQT